MSSIGAVDGSISYLYSSLPLDLASSSASIPLRRVIHGYRQLQQLRCPDDPSSWEIWHGGRRIDRRATLLYGRLFLPTSDLEALYLRRLSPTLQLKLSCISSSTLRSGGSILALLSRDQGKHSQEYLYSTDSTLLGFRGLYNFGPDPRSQAKAIELPASHDGAPSVQASETVVDSKSKSRLSLGAEAYYGVLNKSGGLSCGLRFSTLPPHTGFPYTMTLTLNPLMGSLSSTYAVRAGKMLTLCSRFDFNVYSYDSSLDVGVELWRPRIKRDDHSTEWAAARLRQSGWDTPKLENASIAPLSSSQVLLDSNTAGVLKARVGHSGSMALRWEGRAQGLLYSCGVSVDLRRQEHVVRSVGLEVQFSR